MTCRGIRGAITVNENNVESIKNASNRLLKEMIDSNNITENDIVSIFFSVTEDLNATFPARAARDMGLNHTLCFAFMKLESLMALKSVFESLCM